MGIEQKGFTIVELLVTVTIVSILASLAVAQFQEYRAKAYDVHALSAVNDGRFAVETLLSEDIPSARFGLVSCSVFKISGYDSCLALLPGFSKPEDHVDLMFSINVDEQTYAITGCSNKGSVFTREILPVSRRIAITMTSQFFKFESLVGRTLKYGGTSMLRVNGDPVTVFGIPVAIMCATD